MIKDKRTTSGAKRSSSEPRVSINEIILSSQNELRRGVVCAPTISVKSKRYEYIHDFTKRCSRTTISK